MFFCRDIDMIQYNNVKTVFEYLDHDKNGIVTEADLENVFNPICVTRPMINQIFTEVSSILKENVERTGISLV